MNPRIASLIIIGLVVGVIVIQLFVPQQIDLAEGKVSTFNKEKESADEPTKEA